MCILYPLKKLTFFKNIAHSIASYPPLRLWQRGFFCG